MFRKLLVPVVVSDGTLSGAWPERRSAASDWRAGAGCLRSQSMRMLRGELGLSGLVDVVSEGVSLTNRKWPDAILYLNPSTNRTMTPVRYLKEHLGAEVEGFRPRRRRS